MKDLSFGFSQRNAANYRSFPYISVGRNVRKVKTKAPMSLLTEKSTAMDRSPRGVSKAEIKI
jgi:hypothetical protein